MVSKESLVQRFQGQVTPIGGMDNVAEQQFALLMQDKFPGLTFVYQPTVFTWKDIDNGTMRSTIPDFLFINPNNGSLTFIEITMHSKNGVDPKIEQKEVMLNGNPNIRYVVLYLENLLNIQKYHASKVNFSGAKKIRR